MSELRRNPLTGEWVIVAAERAGRPRSRRPPARRGRPPSAPGATCPFCAGNEAQTPPSVLELAPPGAPVWRVRAFPNKFPALSGPIAQASEQAADALPGRGRHEIIVEAPDHRVSIAGDRPAMRLVLEAYRARLRALEEEGWDYVALFKNHGPRSGGSLDHAHSQVVALPVLPASVTARGERLAAHQAATGGCLHCEVLAREGADRKRIVAEGGRLAAFAPFASAYPAEVWVMSGDHQGSLSEAADGDLDDLAAVLQAVLLGLERGFAEPDYNLVLHTTPPRLAPPGRAYWLLQLIPRLGAAGGLELGTGVYINSLPPEEAASHLRRWAGT